MADVLINPSFPQAEIDRYKTRTRGQTDADTARSRDSSRRSG